MEMIKSSEEEKFVEMDIKEKSTDSTEQVGVDDNKNEDVGGGYQPLLLEDSTLNTLPKYIEKLLLGLDVNTCTQNDLFPILVYSISLESGFMLDNIDISEDIYASFWGFSFHTKNILNLAILPDIYWEVRDHIYKFNIKLINHKTKCLLLCFRTGDSFCITLTNNICPGRSVCLSTARYVLSPIMRKFSSRFRNLKEFSYLLKEHVFVPTRNYIMAEAEEHYPGLMGMPIEILVIVFNKLSIKDLHELSKTCCKLRMLCMEIYERKKKLRKESH